LNGEAARSQAADIRRALRTANDRGRAFSRIGRAAGLVRARWLFRGCETGERLYAASRVLVRADGRIALGDRLQFWMGTIPQELVCERGASLTVGADTMFNYAVSLRATARIAIGARCMFGSHVCVHDAEGAPIEIGDDVWVAHGAVIEPGLRVGTGSVVSAGSVVTADVPDFSLAVGNPARCVPLAKT
jgi:acetyltransferase-like isoleucine patch superfamily enzyme